MYAAIMYACQKGLYDVVLLLTKNGADPNLTAIDSTTASMLAADAGHLNVVQHLVSVGANFNAIDKNGEDGSF